MKFGKYKDDLAKNLYTDRKFDKKSSKDIKQSKEFQEFLKKEKDKLSRAVRYYSYCY